MSDYSGSYSGGLRHYRQMLKAIQDKVRYAEGLDVNLISLIASVGVEVYGLTLVLLKDLIRLMTNYILMQADVLENTIFSREWPRGNLGSLPADSEQFMLIEHFIRGVR